MENRLNFDEKIYCGRGAIILFFINSLAFYSMIISQYNRCIW